MTQFRYSEELQVADIFMDFTVGSSGAPTLNVPNSLGVTSITRISAGKYTVVFAKPKVRLLQASDTFVDASAPASPVMSVTSVANVGSTTAPSVTIVFQTATGTATDPASGERILLQFIFALSPAA